MSAEFFIGSPISPGKQKVQFGWWPEVLILPHVDSTPWPALIFPGVYLSLILINTVRFLGQGNSLNSSRRTRDQWIRENHSISVKPPQLFILKMKQLGCPSAHPPWLRIYVDIQLGPLSSALRLIHQLPKTGFEALHPLDAALWFQVNDSQLCRVLSLFKPSGKKRLWNLSSLLDGYGHLWRQHTGGWSWWRLHLGWGMSVKGGRQMPRLLVGAPEKSRLPPGLSGLRHEIAP